MARKKDGRKTKQFALQASVNNINHWNSMTDAERKARVDRMQAGRRKKQAEREQANREAYTYDPRTHISEGIAKPRSLSLVKQTLSEGNKAVDEWINKKLQHDTPDLDLGDIKMPDFGALAAFNQVTTHRRARTMVVKLKELALKDDGFEITADNEYVGISWLKLQSLVYKIMKEMDEA
jgi:hypothetical protein